MPALNYRKGLPIFSLGLSDLAKEPQSEGHSTLPETSNGPFYTVIRAGRHLMTGV